MVNGGQRGTDDDERQAARGTLLRKNKGTNEARPNGMMLKREFPAWAIHVWIKQSLLRDSPSVSAWLQASWSSPCSLLGRLGLRLLDHLGRGLLVDHHFGRKLRLRLSHEPIRHGAAESGKP